MADGTRFDEIGPVRDYYNDLMREVQKPGFDPNKQVPKFDAETSYGEQRYDLTDEQIAWLIEFLNSQGGLWDKKWKARKDELMRSKDQKDEAMDELGMKNIGGK